MRRWSWPLVLQTGETTGTLQATVSFAHRHAQRPRTRRLLQCADAPDIAESAAGSCSKWSAAWALASSQSMADVQPERFAYAIDMTIGGVKIVLLTFSRHRWVSRALDEAKRILGDPR